MLAGTSGTVFSAALIYTLAMSSDLPSPRDALREFWQGLSLNVFDAAFPMSASDVVTVALGEGLSGILGAMALGGVTALMSWSMRSTSATYLSSSSSSTVTTATSAESQRVTATTAMWYDEAVAGGDFLVARASTLALLEAFGVPPSIAMNLSVVLATVPYELLKMGIKRKREQRQSDDVLLQQLLDEETERKRRRQLTFLSAVTYQWDSLVMNRPTATTENSQELVLRPIQAEKEPTQWDGIEILCDIVKWLQYDVLQADYGGTLHDFDGAPLFPGLEGAIFGAVAVVSAQLYADLLYAYFGLGPDKARERVASRTVADWLAVYLSHFVVGATLFGVYETAQIPVTSFVAEVQSGGAVNCLDSSDFNLCTEAFLAGNPPKPAFDAQFRALVTSLYSAWLQLPFT